jgi:WD40 repeat protein
MGSEAKGGLGISLSQQDGLIKVVTPLADKPAAKAGVLSGDVITAIDDSPTQGLTLDQAVEKIRGAINSSVKLKIVRGPTNEVKEFIIVRGLTLVESMFRRLGDPVRAPSGNDPVDVAFSPDGKRLAVGYDDKAAFDVLDSTTLKLLNTQRPVGVTKGPSGLSNVAWSRDGQNLFAAGSVLDARGRAVFFAWGGADLGDERRMTYCASDTAAGVAAFSDGRLFVSSLASCLGVMDARGEPIWTVAARILDFRDQVDVTRVSRDGQVVDFGYLGSARPVLRFDVRSLTLSSPPPNDGLTFAPNREGLAIDGWRNGTSPTLGGQMLSLQTFEMARSLAIAWDAKRFFLGSTFSLVAFDDSGVEKWRRNRNEVRAVNASKDGRIVTAASYDGSIRWYRADSGRELLALQVFPSKNEPAKWDWVLWTPEGFYEATPGA